MDAGKRKPVARFSVIHGPDSLRDLAPTPRAISARPVFGMPKASDSIRDCSLQQTVAHAPAQA